MEKDFEKFSSGNKNFYDKDLSQAGKDFAFDQNDFSDFEGVTNSWSGNGFNEFEGAKSGFSEFEGTTSGFSDFYDKKGLAKPTDVTVGSVGKETTSEKNVTGKYRKSKQMRENNKNSNSPWVPVVKQN